MIFRSASLAIFGLTLLWVTGCVSTPVSSDGVSIRSLQLLNPKASLSLEKELGSTPDYQSSLLSFTADELLQYTLQLKPHSGAGRSGYPVVIFAHGFHPEPKKYGKRVLTGEDARPGDYYRSVPARYAANGFMVLAPDYRGHNRSEGFEFTQQSFLATSYYAIDVLNLLSAVRELPEVDADRIYLVGHSMGGDVALKAILATNKIRAASLWAPVVATTYQQALYYGKYADKENNYLNAKIMTEYLKKIKSVYEQLKMPVEFSDVDPIEHLAELTTPVMVQHARGDQSVPYLWSEIFVSELHKKNKDYALYTYESDNHLFADENLDLAVSRDIEFFREN